MVVVVVVDVDDSVCVYDAKDDFSGSIFIILLLVNII